MAAQRGHPIHPILVTVPIGTCALACGLDVLAELGVVRDQPAAQAANTAPKAGAVGAVLAAAAGIADWQSTVGETAGSASCRPW